MNPEPLPGIERPSAKGRLLLRLFVAATLPNSVAAIANLRRLCSEPGASHAKVEIIDVLIQPERALAARIVVTPTLLRVYPEPVVTVLGALTDLDRVRAALGLSA